MVDFSKLRLPNAGNEPVDSKPESDAGESSVAPVEGEVTGVENSEGASKPAVLPSLRPRVTPSASEGAVVEPVIEQSVEKNEPGKAAGASGLRLRLPGGNAPRVTPKEVVSDGDVAEKAVAEPVGDLSGAGVASDLGAVNPLLEEDDEGFFEQFPEDDPHGLEDLSDLAEVEPALEELVNPLLDDDDEEDFVSASSVAEGLAVRNGLGGLDSSAGEAEELEPFSGFDDQFQALLEDDDDETGSVSVTESPAGAARESVELEAGGAVGEGKPAAEWASVEVPYRAPKTAGELEEEALERKSVLRKKARDEALGREFKSDFIGASTKVVRVDAQGEVLGEVRGQRRRKKKPSVGGKLKAQELSFFKSLGNLKSEFSDGLLSEDLVTGPLGRTESAAEKRARLANLERALDSRNLFRAGKSFKLDNKTVDTLSFLALFRYATHSHLARLFGESPRTSKDRLYRLRQVGLVASKKIYSQHAIWFLTEAGVIVSGYDVRHITEARLTPSMFPHQFTVNHVAANLMGGKLNVLNLSDFPAMNRSGVDGQPRLGEQLTSELEIQSSFAKIKLFEQSSTFRPKLMSMRDNEFQRWSEAEDKEKYPTPELLFGNEWMFTLFPPMAVGVAYHVPDLVVKRPRGANAKPQSIAVEVEINNKPASSYEKTLRAYAHDELIFGQVVWVCKTVGPAKKLEKIGRELGMIQSKKLKIVPIWTNDGVFRGRDLWTI